MTGKTTIRSGLAADRVEHLDLHEAVRLPEQATVGEVVDVMRATRSGCVLVEADGRMTGIFTERDLICRVLRPGRSYDEPVSTVMTASPRTVRADEPVRKAMEIMRSGGFRHLPVVEADGQIRRICSLKTLLAYLAEYFPDKVFNLPPRPGRVPTSREGA